MGAGTRDAARPVSKVRRSETPAARDPRIRDLFVAAVEHERRGRLELAEQSYREILARAPDHVKCLHNLGAVLRQRGRLGEAEELFRRVLELEPASCVTIYQLTHTRRYDGASDEDIERIDELLSRGKLSDRDAVFLYFSLGKIHDDRHEFDPAFDCYRRGNALLQKRSRFDAGAFARYIDRIIDTFTPELIAGLGRFSNVSELPVYVVGMPRSGTTLVEQILSAHPLVHAAGELTFVEQAIRNLRARAGLADEYPAFVERLEGEVLAAEAANYERFMRGLPDTHAARLVDKMPYNFKHVGLIVLLFARARIVHCRRDPRDVCLSNYFQLYVAGHEQTFSLEALGRYYRDYERLMAHWRRVVDSSGLHEIRYEELVTDLPASAPRLVEFLGLEWDERCLRPHESGRAVQTASAWQVRQPVYSTSVGRWRSYERFLGPLDDALRGD